MPTVPANLLRLVCALMCALAACGAAAEDKPAEKVTPTDIRRALIWTGHYSAFVDGDPVSLFKKATRSWQKSKGYSPTEMLADDEVSELLADGQSKREATGWAKLEDISIGFSVGVPTEFTKFASVGPMDMATLYSFDGSIGYQAAVRYGEFNCATMDYVLKFARRYRPFFQVRRDDWLALGQEQPGKMIYEKIVCRTSGILAVSVAIPNGMLESAAPVFAAMAESLTVSRSFNPTASPHPRVDKPPAPSRDLITVAKTTAPAAKPAMDADNAGKTAFIKRTTRAGPDLSVEQVFNKVSPAVFMVKALPRQGSAVAVSEHDLLTNCHVIQDDTRVKIFQDKKELSAAVVSVNKEADRCVLRTDEKLGEWVTVRPYDDIKTGERALTIGTPKGLELTVADGVVSSKRTMDGRRLVQTTAPMSPGSSGGGLFDAQGHLLGITTFFVKTGQNLNFAIAAEDYAK